MNKKPNIQRIALASDATIVNAVAMHAQLLAALGSASDIEVDLSQVTEIDSAGLQLLISAKQEAAVLQKRLSFAGHSPAVLETLDLCDLSAHFGDPVLLHGRA